MKRLWLGCLLMMSLPVFAQQDTIDIQHYRFHIELSDASDTIKGKAVITILFNQHTKSATLDLANVNGKGKGMRVLSVEWNKQALKYVHENDKLVIEFAKSNKPGEKQTVTVNYAGIPADGLIIAKNMYKSRTFFSDNWPNRAHNWIPCVDIPADKATTEFLVTAPDHYKTVSNGILKEVMEMGNGSNLTHWQETTPLPTKIMAIGVADFADTLLGVVNNIAVGAWVFKQNREAGFANYAAALQVLPFFEKYIAAYPYMKLDNVQSKTIFGGMENANTIFYHENSASTKHNEESLIAHEIAHQWFGDMVTEKHFAHLWLSEGFATYLTHIYIESKYGADSLKGEMKKDRQKIIAFARNNSRPVVDSVSSLMELLNENSYQKGGWVLHMLRKEIGDTLFQQTLQTYYAQYKGKNASTEDFQKVAETISKKNLSQFFKQWLYQGGIPQLNVKWSLAEGGKKMRIQVKQLQPGAPYQFSLTSFIKGTGNDMQLSVFDITKTDQEFLVPLKMSSKPVSIELDPMVSLLFEER